LAKRIHKALFATGVPKWKYKLDTCVWSTDRLEHVENVQHAQLPVVITIHSPPGLLIVYNFFFFLFWVTSEQYNIFGMLLRDWAPLHAHMGIGLHPFWVFGRKRMSFASRPKSALCNGWSSRRWKKSIFGDLNISANCQIRADMDTRYLDVRLLN